MVTIIIINSLGAGKGPTNLERWGPAPLRWGRGYCQTFIALNLAALGQTVWAYVWVSEIFGTPGLARLEWGLGTC